LPKFRNADPVSLIIIIIIILRILNPKSIGFNTVSKTAKFQVIPIMGFCFIVLT